ncbi:SusD/RagB family nutrient-binding outer membrane lipoprotein [Pseudopedobacter beijingensis]|uniref:SusD/RagB family nutrient-binding outer membrane lipoprotein n=1 Tax=Pseudopedobacter beijingensis TaxID=1207056 RepID=A0ABW4ICD3_9SPHI
MKKHIITFCGLFTLLVMSNGCTKGFKDINKNPNTSESVTPDALLAPAIKAVVSANMNRSQRITNEFMQVTVNMGDSDSKLFRYEVRRSEADYLYNNWFLQLANFRDVYKGGEGTLDKGYMGVALICQAWVFSMLTDAYGDVPYFEAAKGNEGIFEPKFDRQEEIYRDIFMKLEEANSLLKTVNTGTIKATSDPIYGGSIAKWRKFGNSLYLRLLLRVSHKQELNTPAKITEIVDTKSGDYPIIANNAESAILRWTGVAPYVSPFATWRPADWSTPKIASFFVDNLNDWGDPRVEKWVTKSQGEYAGIPSGYPIGQAPEGRSAMPLTLTSEPLLGNILNFSELQFILAEAAVRGWVTKNPAKTYYENGIINGITLWGYAAPTQTYLETGSLAWDEGFTPNQKIELILTQKYYSLYFTDMQSWFEYRRTGYPNLPKGLGLGNGGEMPARLNYPVYLQSTNSANYKLAIDAQGPDEISTKVWWQK